MKYFIVICFAIFLPLASTTFAANKNVENIDCFIVKEDQSYLINKGKNCNTRYSPASTFKIALALIGYESGILKDENYPLWESKEPVKYLQDYWSGEKTPSSWMRYSVVWYSQMLTTKLGIKNFQNYMDKLEYGNKDLSGNPEKNDGLTEAWLSSSLLISPLEQISFIEKLASDSLLLFSKESQTKTKNLIRIFEESLLSNGWTIYGKTGSDIDKKIGERKGYFVGFATKDKRLISFVIHITGNNDSKVGGIYAKKKALDVMMKEVLNF